MFKINTEGWKWNIESVERGIRIGSDEFFAPATASRRAPQSFEETWRIIDQLPNGLAENIVRNNAVRIYKL